MRTIITLVFLFCIGCGGERKTVDNKYFVELQDKLPRIETPITFNSNYEIDMKSVEIADNEILTKLRQRNNFSPLGKIFESKELLTIIGYIPDYRGTPVLITFDNEGNEISSHNIWESVMGDMGRYTSNCVTIDSKRNITFTDSTLTRQINKEGDNEIPGTDSLTVTSKRYRISDKGTIEKVD